MLRARIKHVLALRSLVQVRGVAAVLALAQIIAVIRLEPVAVRSLAGSESSAEVYFERDGVGGAHTRGAYLAVSADSVSGPDMATWNAGGIEPGAESLDELAIEEVFHGRIISDSSQRGERIRVRPHAIARKRNVSGFRGIRGPWALDMGRTPLYIYVRISPLTSWG